MSELKELKDWVDDLKSILFDINVCQNNLRILQHERFNKFRVNYFDSYLTLMYQQHFILIIQLAKIFSTKDKTHKRNINKLFNELQKDNFYEDVLSKNTMGILKNREELLIVLKELRAKIDSKADLIKSVMDNRNTVFAHTDPEDLYKKIDLDEYTTLVDLSNEIYNTLFGKLLGDKFHPKIVNKYDLSILKDFSE